MALYTSGASGSNFQRSAGLPTTLGTSTLLAAFKRTATQANERQLWTWRKYGGGDTGTDITIQNPSHGTAAVAAYPNFAATSTTPLDVLTADGWVWVAVIQNGTSFTLATRAAGEGSWETAATTQTAFTPTKMVFMDDESGNRNFAGKVSHIREWNAVLTLAELDDEIESVTAVRTANLLSAKRCVGATLSDCLTGQTGSAFTTVGTVSSDNDEPSFSPPYSGLTLSGTGVFSTDPTTGVDPETPTVITGPENRFNALLYSNDLSNAAWEARGHSISTNAGTPPTVQEADSINLLTNASTTGGVSQMASGLPAGKSVVSMYAKKNTSRWLAIRHLSSDYSRGTWVFFDLETGAVGSIYNFGGVSDGAALIENVGGGYYRCAVSNTIDSARGVEFYAADSDGAYAIQLGASVFVGGIQYEAGVTPTWFKKTSASVVTRTLTSLEFAVPVTTVSANQTFSGSVRALDDTGDPWDFFGPIVISSSDQSKLVANVATQASTNAQGLASFTYTGVANGSANLTATGGSKTATPLAITVGAGSTRFVDVRVEPGWESTPGWVAGVWAAPTGGAVFPAGAKLFEASNLTFDSALTAQGESKVLIPVPTAVSLNAGDDVSVVLRKISGDQTTGMISAEVV